MYSVLQKIENAHDDSLWTCAWGRSEKDGTDYIMTGSIDDKVKIWRWNGESCKIEPRHTLEGHLLGVVSVDTNPAGTIGVSSSLDAHVRLWDLESGKQLMDIDGGPVDVWQVCFSPDGRYVATGGQTGRIHLHSLRALGLESSAAAADGETAPSAASENVVFDTRGKFIMAIAFSPDGHYLASAAIDGMVFLFELSAPSGETPAGGRLVRAFEAHAMPIRALAFSPDSTHLATVADDMHCKLFDVKNATLVSTLAGHSSWVLSVAFSPDGSHFVTSSSDKTVKVWSKSQRTCLHTFYEHKDQVWCSRYSRTGSQVISVGDDRSLIVYETRV